MVKRNLIIALLFQTLLLNVVNGQNPFDTAVLNQKPLKGYFLFFGAEIINTDHDVRIFKSHQIFYSPIITDSVLMDFTGDLLNDSTTLVKIMSPYNNSLIKEERKYLLNYLTKKYTFQELIDFSPFIEAEKSIPIELFENDTVRYVSIFSGELPVIGPFNGIDFRNQFSPGSTQFIYLPTSKFKFMYHYSCVLPYDYSLIQQEYRELLKERQKGKKGSVHDE